MVNDLVYLLLSILALFVGVKIASKFEDPFKAKIASFIISLIVLLIIFGHILPDLAAVGGREVFFFFAIGFVIVFLFELFSIIPRKNLTKWASIIAILGLAVHTVIDGFAIFQMAHLPHFPSHSHQHSHNENLVWLFILHRLPVGMFLWFQFGEQHEMSWVVKISVLFAATSLGGYLLGSHYSSLLMENVSITQFQAFGCGVLAHIVFEPIQLAIQRKYEKKLSAFTPK